MGLLDWLSEGLGDIGGSGGGGMSNPMGDMTGQPTMPAPPPPQSPPMPPVQGMENNGPTPQVPISGPDPGAQPGVLTSDADLATSGAVPPSGNGVPLPMARPPGLGAPPAAPDPAALPAAGAPTSLAPPPPGMGVDPSTLTTGLKQLGSAPEGSSTSKGILESALGISPERAGRVRGALAAGLKSVGDNANKPGLAAFSGSMGSGMEGGQKRDDKAYDQKISALSSAIKSKAAGDEAGYKTGYLKYLNNKAAGEAATGKNGKSGAWQKPDSQKFIDASNAMNKDRDVIASQKVLEGAIKNGDPKAIAAAQAQHTALTEKKKGEYLTGVGLDPKQIAFNSANPPGTQQNPHKVTSQSDFDTYVKPGQAYINPKDGKTYIRKGEGGGADGAPAGGASSKDAPVDPTNPKGGSGIPTMPTTPAATDDED